MFPYRIVIEWHEPDAGYIATVPALPGCSAFGEDVETAAKEIRIAAELYVESLRSSGQTPPPSDLASPPKRVA